MVIFLLFSSSPQEEISLTSVDILIQGLPVRTNVGSLGLCTVALIEDGTRILFDTGHYGTRRILLEAFEKRGIRPRDIDTVVLSHSNWDHVLNIDLFADSRVLIHKDEFNYAKDPKDDDWATPTFLPDILREMDVNTISDETNLTKDVKIIETIGHTIGHVSLLVSEDERTSLFAQDALPSARSYHRELPDYVFYSEDEARKSILKIKSLNPDTIYPGHDRPFTVEKGEINYIGSGDFKLGWRGEKEEDLWITFEQEKAV